MRPSAWPRARKAQQSCKIAKPTDSQAAHSTFREDAKNASPRAATVESRGFEMDASRAARVGVATLDRPCYSLAAPVVSP